MKQLASILSENGTFLAYYRSNLRVKNIKKSHEINGPIVAGITCLCFVILQESSETIEYIALGTSKGKLSIYSIARNEIVYQIDDSSHRAISCLVFDPTHGLFSASECDLVNWNVANKTINYEWKTGNERIGRIAVVKSLQQILTASNEIKLWDLQTKTVLKTFFCSPLVCILDVIETADKNQCFFLYGAKNESNLSIWNLNENRKPFIQMIAERNPIVADTFIRPDSNKLLVSTITTTKTLLVYEIALDSEYKKPIEQRLYFKTIYTVTDSLGQNTIVEQLMYNSFFHDPSTIILFYGSQTNNNCEFVTLNFTKPVQYLIRESKTLVDPSHVKQTITNEKRPRINRKQVEIVCGQKRKFLEYDNDDDDDVNDNDDDDDDNDDNEPSIQKRLKDLSETKQLPSLNSIVQIFCQAIETRNSKLLASILIDNLDETIIEKTVLDLPYKIVIDFMDLYVPEFIQSKKPELAVAAKNWTTICLARYESRFQTYSRCQTIIAKIQDSVRKTIECQRENDEIAVLLEFIIPSE